MYHLITRVGNKMEIEIMNEKTGKKVTTLHRIFNLNLKFITFKYFTFRSRFADFLNLILNVLLYFFRIYCIFVNTKLNLLEFVINNNK